MALIKFIDGKLGNNELADSVDKVEDLKILAGRTDKLILDYISKFDHNTVIWWNWARNYRLI